MEEPIVSGLDAALHELGMLSSVTQSRREYLKEQQIRQCNFYVLQVLLTALFQHPIGSGIAHLGNKEAGIQKLVPDTGKKYSRKVILIWMNQKCFKRMWDQFHDLYK